MHAMHVQAGCMDRGTQDASADDVRFVSVTPVVVHQTLLYALLCPWPCSTATDGRHVMREVQCMPCVVWAIRVGRGSQDATADDVGFAFVALVVGLQTFRGALPQQHPAL